MNITYYIGAGASCEAVPMASELAERLVYFKNYLNNKHRDQFNNSPFSIVFEQKIKELIKEIKLHRSIDAIAYRYYLSGKTLALYNLKLILTSLLIFEQFSKPDSELYFNDTLDHFTSPPLKNQVDQIKSDSINRRIDPRYFHFIMPKLNKGDDSNLLDKLNIVSWNYDIQFELAVNTILDIPLLNVPQKLPLIKLNGELGYFRTKSNDLISQLLERIDEPVEDVLALLINLLEKNSRRIVDDLIFSFAWENEIDVVVNNRKHAKKIINQTDVLVIIGYSFPEFNFNVDREILKDASKLTKIYYQIPNQDFLECKERLMIINDKFEKLIVHKSNCYYFYTPAEYYNI